MIASSLRQKTKSKEIYYELDPLKNIVEDCNLIEAKSMLDELCCAEEDLEEQMAKLQELMDMVED